MTSSAPSVYAFTVRGSAFLWHQVRCMVAVMFLVGQGLEPPSVVKELLDTTKNPRRPMYEMADDKPLVLWDCTFSKTAGKFAQGELPSQYWDRGTGPDELDWIYEGDHGSTSSHLRRAGKWGRSGLMNDLWRVWRGPTIDGILATQLMDLAASQGSSSSLAMANETATSKKSDPSTWVFAGGDSASNQGIYTPLMQREKLDTVENINTKYLARKSAAFRRPDVE